MGLCVWAACKRDSNAEGISMSRRYRHVPLSQERLNHYERMRFHVTKKKFGEYTDTDIDVTAHCTDTQIPVFLIHQPRRFCTVDMDWHTAGIELSLPAYQQVSKWVQQALDASPAPKSSKRADVGPRGVIAHGLELDHAQQLCNRVWEYLLEGVPGIPRRPPEGGEPS